MTRLRSALRTLLQIDEPPARIALAFAVGVWISFTPFVGLHTWMALGTALAFRLNRVALVVGAWVNVWTLAPTLMAGTALGCTILGVSSDGLARIDWDMDGMAFFHMLFRELKPFVWPFLLGNLLVGLPAAAIAYFVLKSLLLRRARTAATA